MQASRETRGVLGGYLSQRCDDALHVARTGCRLRIRAESLRLAYSGFYDRLRVSPEEPGVGQFDLLVRSIGLMALAEWRRLH
jgi:hypothetical protein